jgi:hypothetical protein
MAADADDGGGRRRLSDSKDFSSTVR